MIRTDGRLVPLFAIAVTAVPAAAGTRDAAVPVAIAAARLDHAVASLAAQARVDIGGTDPALAAIRVPGLHGRLAAKQALDRLLRGTPFRAERIDAATFRIGRRSPRRQPVRPTPPVLPPVSPPDPVPDIVVTAAKSGVAPLRLAGAITVLGGRGATPFGRNALHGMSDAAVATPILQETALGTGRNKLFIRGVADSSFSGPTQSTAAVYWGDVPVAYNGADPGLNLYDVDRVEILEGPQGTLYGAGAIGGVIRLAPRVPDLTVTAAEVSGGVDLTKGSRSGSDLAGMVNLPLAGGSLGLRGGGYRLVEGGYIDDAGRGLRDVNDVRTTGGRLMLRAVPAAGWTVDVGLIGQRVAATDLQYAERGLPGLARTTTLAQPFRQDYGLVQWRAERRWASGLTLLSATGYARRDARSRFDATRTWRTPIAYDTDERSRLLSHETRLSRGRGDGAGWLLGIALLRATDLYTRRVGPVDRQRDIVGTANRTVDAALFGQAGIALTPRLTVTLGERLTHQRSDGEPVSGRRGKSFIRGVSVTRLDPTVGASWLVAPGTAIYARYQSGFRTGGIVVAPGIGRVADLVPDTIRVMEAGVRHERQGARGVAGSIGVSDARWRHVQANLIDRAGFPFITNIGDSRILGLEATANWVPLPGLTLAAATFIAHTPLTPVAGRPLEIRADRVPNTPPFAASGSIGYAWRPTAAGKATLALDWHYVGRSVVGSLAPFDVEQGGFGVAGAHAEWGQGRWSWTLTLDNLLDVKGDRFASGNPFTTTIRPAYTPVRPRSLRAGVVARF